MKIETQQFIAARRSADGTARFQAGEAATGAALEPTFVDASEAEIDAACREAEAAAPAYRALAPEARAAFLETVAGELDALAEAFVERTTRETGLPEARIRGELGRTTGQLRLFAGVVRAGDHLGVRIDRADPERTPAPKPDLRQYRVPLGPVAVFGASNFPLAFSVAGGDTASALAAGCPVVVKAHPAHPGTSALVADAIARSVERSGLHAGVFSMVQGKGNEVGGALVRHPAIRAVGFTGSHRGGMALKRLADERPNPIPVYAEMGSVNPVFLLPQALGARGEAIASGFAGSLTMGCGQFCTNPGVLFAVAGQPLEDFLDAVASGLAEAEPGVMLHAGILSAYEQGRARLQGASGVSEVVHGGEADGRATPAVYRTTLANFLDNPELGEEVFGPTALVVEVPDAAALVRAANAMAGQLTATLQGESAELADHAALIEALERRAGRVLFNGFPTGVEVTHAMVHGGPYPATSDSRTTSVGTLAIDRWLRPVCYQDFPEAALPDALKEANPLGLRRLVDGGWD